MKIVKLLTTITNNPKSCFYKCPVVIRARQDVKLSGMSGISLAQTFVLPQQKRILIVDPNGYDSAAAMWNLMAAMMGREHKNRLILSQAIKDNSAMDSKAQQERFERFATSYDAAVEFLDLIPPTGGERWSKQELSAASTQLRMLEPDIICLPHPRAFDEVQRETSLLYLKAIAGMIVSHIETCKQLELKDLLARRFTILFYENYASFTEAGILPNLYHVVFPRESDLRLNYYNLHQRSDEQIFASMRRNMTSDANEKFWDLLEMNPGDFYFERFVEYELGIVDEDQGFIEAKPQPEPEKKRPTTAEAKAEFWGEDPAEASIPDGLGGTGILEGVDATWLLGLAAPDDKDKDK